MEKQDEFNPVDLDMENAKAEEFIKRDELPAAARILVKIVNVNSENSRAYNNMGIISWKQKAWHDAYDSFKNAVELNPENIDALSNLFDAALKLKRIDQIIPLYRKSTEILPDQKEIHTILEEMENQGEEIYETERAMAIGTYDEDIEEGDKLLSNGDLNEAAEYYLKVIDTKGPNADAYCGLGIISFHQEKYRDAFTLFFESIKQNPVRKDVFQNMIDAAEKAGELDEAAKIVDFYSEKISDIKRIIKPYLENKKNA
ncbi:MAG: tetratricopeptide repeat protein [Chitinivibrionales bacterium]